MASKSEIVITLPGGRRVDAQVRGHVVHTDQPVEGGGEDAAPSPYEMFLASIGTCAGIFVQGFCATRGIPFENIRIRQRLGRDESGAIARVELDVELPEEFPERYRDAVVKAIDGCSVKRTIQAQPQFVVRTEKVAAQPAVTH
jgi:putative redox protein